MAKTIVLTEEQVVALTNLSLTLASNKDQLEALTDNDVLELTLWGGVEAGLECLNDLLK